MSCYIIANALDNETCIPTQEQVRAFCLIHIYAFFNNVLNFLFSFILYQDIGFEYFKYWLSYYQYLCDRFINGSLLLIFCSIITYQGFYTNWDVKRSKG